MAHWRCHSSYYDPMEMVVLFNYQLIPCNDSTAPA